MEDIVESFMNQSIYWGFYVLFETTYSAVWSETVEVGVVF